MVCFLFELDLEGLFLSAERQALFENVFLGQLHNAGTIDAALFGPPHHDG